MEEGKQQNGGMFPIIIYDRLPLFFQELLEHSDGRERDLLLLSSLTVLSNCLPFVSGIYNGNEVYPHLYSIIIAPAASGKGRMTLAKYLIDGINNYVYESTKKANEKCEEEKKNDKNMSDVECPQVVRKVIPANISSAAFYKLISKSKQGVLLFETESDTLTQILGNDWANLSDLLRKAFHNEGISMARADDTFIELREPKLSILLSGTPEQLKLLMKNKENGLFSRFLIYEFYDISDFIDVFADKSQNLTNSFKIKSQEILNLFIDLKKINGIKFKLTASEKRLFLLFFRKQQKKFIEKDYESIISNLKRFALIAFRIAMILTVLRNKNNLQGKKELECSKEDFLVALSIVETLLEHTKNILLNFDTDFLPEQDKNILDDLQSPFTRQDAIKTAEEFGMPQRTIDDKLVQWINKKILVKVKRGIYKKT